MTSDMTPEEEYEFYADPANLVPVGKPRRRKARLTAPIPVRFPEGEPAVRRAAPKLGEHTREVLSSIGIDGASFDALQAQGVV